MKEIIEPAIGDVIDINGKKYKCSDESGQSFLCKSCDLYMESEECCGAWFVKCIEIQRKDKKNVAFKQV